MTNPSRFPTPLWLMLSAALAMAGVWLCAQRVVIRHQIADAAARDFPRGNLSDLYPRWLGARELLLHGRDPYSPAVTREIQQGYYGRVLDSARPDDPRDQEAFAYPPYVVFVLAPTIHLPFDTVRRDFFWVLLVLTVLTVPLWLRLLRWRVPWWTQVSIVMLTLGSLPFLQALKLEQITLFVTALVAASLLLFVSGFPVPSGVALALATIKPQHVWLLLLWLTIWTLADCRRRYHWAASFLGTMAVLFAASEWVLPHWIPRFLQAARDYRNYTNAASVLDALLPTPWGRFLEILVAGAILYVCWRNRRCQRDTPAFAATTSGVLAATVILTIIPSYALYNQVLLLPAVLWLVHEHALLWREGVMRRGLLILVGLFLVWPWVASFVLAGLSFLLPPETVQAAWPVPFWTVPLLPVGVVAMMLIALRARPFTAPAEPGPS